MKKHSSRRFAVLTNCLLAAALIVIAAVCFLPAGVSVARVEEGVYYRGTRGVSLMVNVYWGTEEVYSMLDVLDKEGAKATFFLGGSWADDNADCVREIVSRGHEVGSHGYFHRDHAALGYEGNLQEIRASVDFLASLTGASVQLFAPPSGAYNKDTLSAARTLGLKTVLWSKDTIDWRDKNEEDCFRRATKGAEAGDLVLMHPMAHTIRALPKILAYYREQGLQVIPVGENLA